MNGRIEMLITEDNIATEVELELRKGLVDKCHILEAMCRALRLEGSDRRVVLAAVAMKTMQSEGKE